VDEIAGYVRRPASVKDCERVGATDYATTDLLAAVSDADLVVLCTPLAQMKPLVKQLLPALKRGAIVTDVGSVKGSVVKDLETLVAKAGAHFIGSHPMAGAEKVGVRAARADLFAGAVCVVTGTKRTNATALKRVEKFWKTVGCRVMKLSPEQHDLLVSRSSHLPHVVAATLASHVLNPSAPKSQAALCATGFRDTTRIASGSPEMWRDIALANRQQLRVALDEFVRELQKVQALLRQPQKNALQIGKFFETAKQRRDAWCAASAGSTE
jgi:prephenate dehydrogenase